jgi:hypothetical protein
MEFSFSFLVQSLPLSLSLSQFLTLDPRFWETDYRVRLTLRFSGTNSGCNSGTANTVGIVWRTSVSECFDLFVNY